MPLTDSLFFPLFCLFGSAVLGLSASALTHLGPFKSKEVLRQRLLRRFESKNLLFSLALAKQIYVLLYATTSFLFFPSAIAILPILLLSLLTTFFMTLLGNLWSRQLLFLSSPFTALYLLLSAPITFPLLTLFRLLYGKIPTDAEEISKAQIHEMLRESELRHHLDPSDQKMIASFLNFKERVAKEIMIPRVDIFSLPDTTSIREAARLFALEGYSRIPIYKESLDQISGVVLYKDLLQYLTQQPPALDTAIEAIAKPVLYAPENKKASQLLQEFRSKQIHMAIIVDEYGGTEGIVTIEDILEELVGEIEDEYDIDAKDFWALPEGGWVVDAKMTLIDIENQLNIQIPESPDYETIGGYIFHCAGTIPSKGWKISHDSFDLEVLASTERALKKIKITPRTSS